MDVDLLFDNAKMSLWSSPVRHNSKLQVDTAHDTPDATGSPLDPAQLKISEKSCVSRAVVKKAITL